VFRIEQSGRSSLRRPKLPIKGGSAPEEEEESSYVLRKKIKNGGLKIMKNWTN